jgi:hypothetical protein
MGWYRHAIVVVAIGCGGRVVDDGRGGGGNAAGGGQTTGSSSGGTVELPPCEPGFDGDAEPERACAWLDPDGLCYDTKLAACACACRKTSGKVCSSPLLDVPDSRIPVDCF